MDSDEELGQKRNSGDNEAIRVSEQKALILEIVYLVTSICNVMLRLVCLAISMVKNQCCPL